MKKDVLTKRRLITIGLLLLLLLFVSTSLSFAAYEVVVSASVKPFYSLQTRGNTLFLQTNMTVYLNGNRMFH